MKPRIMATGFYKDGCWTESIPVGYFHLLKF